MTSKRRPLTDAERIGNAIGSMADGTLGGRMRIASPVHGVGGRVGMLPSAPPGQVEPDPIDPAQGVSLTLSTPQVIPTGTATPIEWGARQDAPLTHRGWSAYSAGDSALVAEHAGELVLSLHLRWDTYTGGGTVQVKVGVDTFTFGGQTDVGAEFTETIRLQVDKGASVSVLLTQASGDNQTLADGALHLTLIPAPVVRTYPNAVLALGPVGYWRLGEASASDDAIDLSGNGNHGTYIGTTNGVAGALTDGDTAVEGNGTSSWVRLQDPATSLFDIGADGWTVKLWTRKGTLAPSQSCALVYRGAAGTSAPAYNWSINQSTNGALSFTMYDDDGNAHTVSCDQAGANGFAIDEWHMVVATWDGEYLRGYVDGVLVQTIEAGHLTPKSLGTTGLDLFRRADLLTDSYYDGALDEVAVFPLALTAGEIRDLHDLGTS